MAFAMMAAITLTTNGAYAFKVNDNNSVGGYATVWGILDESAFNTATDSSGEKGKDKSFGFQIKQMRLGAKGDLADKVLGYNVLFDGSGSNSSVAFVEGWITLRPLGDVLDINIGQMRPYGTYEVGITSGGKIENLDVYQAGKKQMTSFLADSGNNTRDRGVELVFKKLGGMADLRITATNGYGNNGDVGGSISGSKAIWANGTMDAAYTAALILTPVEGLRINAGYGINKHENAVVNVTSSTADLTTGAVSSSSSKVVVDLDRSMYSVGAKLDVKDLGLWIDGEYAALKGADKDTLAGGYEVKGYYARLGYFLVPNTLELIGRYQGWDEIKSKGASEKKNTGYDLGVRLHVDAFVFTLEYEKQDLDGTSDDPTRLAFRTVLYY
ncbi:MAG: hypothetical protein HY751_07915 [Nitrospinae bacterium]|nr:hypothetical protein [Nitrospinota bacterium]